MQQVYCRFAKTKFSAKPRLVAPPGFGFYYKSGGRMEFSMLDFSNFIVRISGRGSNAFYIDCAGLYHISDIASGAGVSSEKIAAIYDSNGGKLNPELDVYYFSSVDDARKAISDIYVVIHNSSKGKSVFFTQDEIDHLRKALIYNASSFAGIDSRMADTILKKLNG